MVVYKRRQKQIRGLKLRFFKNKETPRLRYGSCGLYVKNTSRFEYAYLLYFRKFLKKLSKNRKLKYKFRKIWMFFRPNYIITKKSKNSRMGKGKGKFIRWCSILNEGFMLVEFRKFNLHQIIKYKRKLEHRLKFPLNIKIYDKNFYKKKEPDFYKISGNNYINLKKEKQLF